MTGIDRIRKPRTGHACDYLHAATIGLLVIFPLLFAAMWAAGLMDTSTTATGSQPQQERAY